MPNLNATPLSQRRAALFRKMAPLADQYPDDCYDSTSDARYLSKAHKPCGGVRRIIEAELIEEDGKLVVFGLVDDGDNWIAHRFDVAAGGAI